MFGETDIEALRFSYESDLLKTFSARFGAVPLRGYYDAQNLLEARKRELLGDAVRVTDDLLPEVHQVYQDCLGVLGGNYAGDLFVRQSKEYNASVFALGRKFDVLINSALLNDFAIDELRFVLGHELGHVVFKHSQFPVHDILTDKDGVSAEMANLLFRWSRASEVSADRVGLLCTGKLVSAVTALFRTSSGLSNIDENRVLRSFRRQYDDLEKHIREIDDSHSWIRTHPMMPIRFKAMELAALDVVSLRQQSKGFSWKGFRAIDRQIAFILDALDADAAPSSGQLTFSAVV
ncbi:MAG: M48 family metallopeptidase [Desulfobacteraceae bacterium]|nr:M48 family metallopeptidase [Desulfobacteraceae bacterium]